MGSRNYRWRERKKPKKSAKKILTTEVLPPQTNVEVVRKGKKERKVEEE